MVPPLLAAARFDGKGLVQLRSDDDRKIDKFCGGDLPAFGLCGHQWTPPTQSKVEGVSGVSWGRDGCPWSAAFALTCRVGALLLMTAEDLS